MHLAGDKQENRSGELTVRASAALRRAALRFRIDSSEFGPRASDPVILAARKIGDRAWVFFASPEEISTFIKHDA